MRENRRETYKSNKKRVKKSKGKRTKRSKFPPYFLPPLITLLKFQSYL